MSDNLAPTELAPAERELLAELQEIALRAGARILSVYARGGDIEVEIKADSSPVTEADQIAEDVILEALARLTPTVPIVSEEAMAAGKQPRLEGTRFWLVDPLDGTKEFISRNGEFTVNIALIDGGTPVAGVVHAPALETTWLGAAGMGEPGMDEPGVARRAQGAAFLAQGKAPATPIRARAIPEAGATVIASRRHGSGGELDSFLADFTVAERISAGSSLKFCHLASGTADLYPRFGRTMEWDTAAGHAVLRAAGGSVRTRDGAPLGYGKPGFENPYFIARGLDPSLT